MGGSILLGLLGRSSLTPASQNTSSNEKKPLPFVPGSWTIVILPDTQDYAEKYPGLFDLQTQWIVDNKDNYNIKQVLHLGDITNRATDLEWSRASNAMARLDGIIPYAIVPGNHDIGPGGTARDRTTRMNKYFPPKRFKNQPTFAGTMGPGSIENNYHLFTEGGQNFLILGLEFAPRDKTLRWADKIISAHPHRKTIVITHAYLYHDSTRYDHQKYADKQSYNPYIYGISDDVNDGEQMWQKLISKHENSLMVISGHVLGDGLGFLISEAKPGNEVYQMLVNFQNKPLGGESWLRLMEFLPDGKTIQVKNYCPLYDKYKTGPQDQFIIKTGWANSSLQ